MIVLSSSQVALAEPLRTGIDVLVDNRFAPLAGERVGLITNHTGVDRFGRSTIDLLHAAEQLELVRIFSPEHGIAGLFDTAAINDSTHSDTGIPISSLYGESRRPLPATLANVDTLVFDIQDIGTRFYTYVSTMGNAMIAAAEQDIRFVVLDRPNPINGVAVAGPVLDDGRQSFVGFHTIPIRHGMTVGELALMLQAELTPQLDLTVVRMHGWHRSDHFDGTGLNWINPSPNMRSLDAALLYPGIGLLETTNVSVGRGTPTPFEMLGAPWLDGEALLRHLRSRNIAGVAFERAVFAPDASTFAGDRCDGIRISIVARERLKPVRLGLEIALYLARTYPQRWDIDAYIRLLGSAGTLDAIRNGNAIEEIEAAYQPGLDAFLARRARFLQYD